MICAILFVLNLVVVFLTDSLVKDGDGPTSTHYKSVVNDLGILKSSKDPLDFHCHRFLISLCKIFANNKLFVKLVTMNSLQFSSTWRS